MPDNFLELMEMSVCKFRGENIQSKANKKKSTPRNIVVKLLKAKNEEKNLIISHKNKMNCLQKIKCNIKS